MTLLSKYRTDYGNNLGEHDFMTQFTEAIGSSIGAFDNHSLGVNSPYYEALAWSGDMLSTTSFNLLDQQFQDLIKQANKDEGSAARSATNNAKGNKCP